MSAFAAVAVVGLALLALWCSALVMAVVAPAELWPDGGRSKFRGILVIVLFGILGSTIFFVWWYPKIRRKRASIPQRGADGRSTYSAFDTTWD